MNSLVQIRNVPEETRRALKARAAARGASLNAYLLELLKQGLITEDAARSRMVGKAQAEQAAKTGAR